MFHVCLGYITYIYIYWYIHMNIYIYIYIYIDIWIYIDRLSKPRQEYNGDIRPSSTEKFGSKSWTKSFKF